MNSHNNISDIVSMLKSSVLAIHYTPDDISLPSFDDIKKKDIFYKYFSDTVCKYQKVCNDISKLQWFRITAIRLLKDLNTSKELLSQRSALASDLRNISDDCQSLIECFKSKKESLESAVKFFNSAQYLLTSNQLVESHVDYDNM